jgi:hypothetical protein
MDANSYSKMVVRCSNNRCGANNNKCDANKKKTNKRFDAKKKMCVANIRCE